MQDAGETIYGKKAGSLWWWLDSHGLTKWKWWLDSHGLKKWKWWLDSHGTFCLSDVFLSGGWVAMGVAGVQWWLDGHGFERLVSGGWMAMWELLVWSWCLGGHRLNK